MIEIQNLCKTFGASKAVDDVSFKVETGQFCMLVGTSGSGKSTTLRMINRLIEPTSGKILINGEDVTKIPGEQLRRRIGYAIQGIGLFPHRNIYDNIATVPHLLGWDKAAIDERVRELLELFHLDFDSFAYKFPRQLSGGQQQRVGVARALAAKPELLLMDEPFGALDPITRDHLQDEMLRIQKQLGITLIMVTHDMEEAVKMGDVIAVMDQGQLLQMTDPEDLLRNPREGFVKNLVGGVDRSLRLLSLTKVGDVMVSEAAHTASNGAAAAEAHLSANDNLRDALCRLMWDSSHSLPVLDDQGAEVGHVSLQDVVEKGARV